MKKYILHSLFACFVILSENVSGEETSSFADTVRKSLTDYHAKAEAASKPNGATLRIIYFRPSDVKPQKDYEARITRIMLDIQKFLKVEMARYGFKDAVLPLEMKGDKVRIYMVTGKEGAEGYSHKAGNKVKIEMRESLKKEFKLDDEFVLVFHGMCRIDGERKYHFYAPYYGDRGSNHQRGLCHVADCEILDPQLLTDTKRQMSYTEHYGEYKQSVAGFNTKYLGGVIHELGHGLSLPHNSQTRDERRNIGTALMGQGNHTYRKEVWSKSKGSFLTLASAIRLASHPLFTGSDHQRSQSGLSTLKDVKFGGQGKELKITGAVESTPDAYAVISYVDPEGGSDYDAVATAVPVTDGKFNIDVACIKSGAHQLRLVVCHLNGATSIHRYAFTANQDSEPEREKITPEKRQRRHR